MAVVVAESRDAIFAPAVGAAAGVIVWKVIPRGAAGAIVFTHGSPLALAEIGPPLSPGLLVVLGFLKAFLLVVHGRGRLDCVAAVLQISGCGPKFYAAPRVYRGFGNVAESQQREIF